MSSAFSSASAPIKFTVTTVAMGAPKPLPSVVVDFKKNWDIVCSAKRDQKTMLSHLVQSTSAANFKLDVDVPLDRRTNLPPGSKPSRTQALAIAGEVRATLGDHVHAWVSFETNPGQCAVKLILVPNTRVAVAGGGGAAVAGDSSDED
jgi:hypothetical protein